MKGKTLLLLLSLSIAISSISQQVREDDYKPKNEFEAEKYGPNPKKVTTVSTDERLNRVVTVEYKTAGGKVLRKKTFRKNLQNTWEITDTCYNREGKVLDDEKYVFDSDNKLVFIKWWFLNHERNSEGKYPAREGGDPLHPKRVKFLEDRALNEIKEIEKELMPSVPDTPAPCDKRQSCVPKMQLFGGYSYLNADFGNERESFPLGAQASLVINLSPHIGLGPDISFHTKTIDDQTITRMFFLAKGQYNFGNYYSIDSFGTPDLSNNSCVLPKIVPDLHVYVGLSTERSVIKIADERFTSSGSGFTFGAGVGLHVNLNKNIGLGIQVDYLGTKFKEADEINSDVRGSAGLFFNLGNAAHEMKFGRGYSEKEN